MKYLIVLTIAIFGFAAADLMTKVIHEKCIEEIGLTKEQTESLGKPETPDDKEIKDYMLCSAKKQGFFDEASGLNVDRLTVIFDTMMLDSKKSREIVTRCNDNNEQKSPAADWIYRIMKCLKESDLSELFKEAQEKINKGQTNEA